MLDGIRRKASRCPAEKFSVLAYGAPSAFARRGGGGAGLGGRCGGNARLDIVDNPRARLAMEHLGAVGAPHFLDHVRADNHSARAAFLVANLSQGPAVVFPDDAIVMI